MKTPLRSGKEGFFFFFFFFFWGFLKNKKKKNLLTKFKKILKIFFFNLNQLEFNGI